MPGVNALPALKIRFPPIVIRSLLPDTSAPELETLPRDVRLFPLVFRLAPDSMIKLPTVPGAESVAENGDGMSAVLVVPGTNPQFQLLPVLKLLVPPVKVQVAAKTGELFIKRRALKINANERKKI